MTTPKLAIVTLSALLLVGSLASGAAASSNDAAGVTGPMPGTAYFVVDLHYCTARLPGGPDGAPSGAAEAVYAQVLIGEYGGNCDAFYAREVLPRLYLSHEHS